MRIITLEETLAKKKKNLKSWVGGNDFLILRPGAYSESECGKKVEEINCKPRTHDSSFLIVTEDFTFKFI